MKNVENELLKNTKANQPKQMKSTVLIHGQLSVDE